MFNRFNPPHQSRPIQKNDSDGCKIRVGRDKSGKIRSISTNGKCSKSELEIFRENIGSLDEDSEGED